ncbi:eEF1A lysine and N-terminal methyltransferase-like isoform X1 [Branchiostoma lanceolatum]|uniref:eEF1A lysine and N-terminal methyltransferase-like isoform X1 n=1 Tax=Branchiostoma lanceolatum TaxID=7740 RepID=UPI003454362F
MDLLPRSHTEFSSVDYWDTFFRKRGEKAFEWYGEYPELCGILHKYIKPQEQALVVGCGNSRLSEDLYDVGYRGLTNVDISDVVVRQMTERNAEKRADMKFLQMDVMKMDFPDSSFSAVLDKGTLDALMPDNQSETQEQVTRMFDEVGRILKVGGRYVIITLSQEHIMKKLLQYFPQEGWITRVHKVSDSDRETSQKEMPLPVFIFVFTKFKKMPQMNKILEVCLGGTDTTQRLSCEEDVMRAVKERQHYAMLRQQLQNRGLEGETVCLELFSSSSSSSVPKYILHIVETDTVRAADRQFAVFIVPQGREVEWLFATDEGRGQLAGTAGFRRLVVVSLQREHPYETMAEIQKELSGKIMELAPPGFNRKIQVPFLSVGADIGTRTVCYEGTSQFSGPYVVEDVEGEDGIIFRNLIFLSNRNAVQSQARMVQENKIPMKKGRRRTRKKIVVDCGYLACQHHRVMVAGLGCLPNIKQLLDTRLDVVLVGLGGGGLPLFLHKHFSKIQMDVVELDQSILQVAEGWFGFQQDERMRVHVTDGLVYLEEQAKQASRSCHVVILDVDSKDVTVGMSFPPQPFVDEECLKNIKDILNEDGLFILNLSCRDMTLRASVVETVRSVFPRILSKKIEDEVNEILFCFPREKDVHESCDDGHMAEFSLEELGNLKESVGVVEKVAKGCSQRWDPTLELTEQLDGLKLA